MFVYQRVNPFFSYLHPDDASPKCSPCFLPQATERFVGQLIDSVGVHLHRDSAVEGRNLVRSIQKTSICIHLLIDLKVTDSQCCFNSYVSICFFNAFQCSSQLIWLIWWIQKQCDYVDVYSENGIDSSFTVYICISWHWSSLCIGILSIYLIHIFILVYYLSIYLF